MKCERCLKQEATVHLTEILDNKKKREVHICDACAASEQTPQELMGMLAAAFPPPAARADPAGLRCEDCGLGYMEFRQRGRLGCSACYDVFQKSLEPLLEKIHGGTRHVGKTPEKSSSPERGRDRRLVELRRELQTAVRGEQYELAARLRDELSRVESGVLEPTPEDGGEGDEDDEEMSELTTATAAIAASRPLLHDPPIADLPGETESPQDPASPESPEESDDEDR